MNKWYIRFGCAVIFALVAIGDYLTNYSNLSNAHAIGVNPIIWTGVYYASLVGLTYAIMVILGSFSRVVFSMIFVWAVVYFAIATYLKVNFQRVVSAEIIMMAMTTNAHEVIEFVKDALSVRNICGLCGLLIVIIVGCKLVWCLQYPRRSRRNIFVAIIFSLLFIVCNCVFVHPIRSASRIGFFYWPFMSVRHYIAFRNIFNAVAATNLPKHLEVPKDIIGVIYIGESVTRNRMGLYDDKVMTTPCLQRLKKESELFVFRDVVAASAGTLMATRFLLTDADATTDGAGLCLPMICNRAGYKCQYICSNSWDGEGGMFGALYRGCTKVNILPDSSQDDKFSSILDSEIKDTSGSFIAFMNGWGSHYPWIGETMKAGYDKTIRRLDEQLTQIIGILEASHRPSFLLYVSDHGESPNSATWRQLGDKDVWEIPLIIWLSKEYKTRFPDVVKGLENAQSISLQTDQLFWGLTRMVGIVGIPGYEKSKDFISSEFIARVKRKLPIGGIIYEDKWGRK